jgi:hypothetical protein
VNTNDEMQTFLREGLERYYADAKESVTTFEEKIQELLVRQCEAKLHHWSNFHPRLVKAVYAGVSVDVGRPSISARTNDENGNGIELGIEWGTFEPRRPILYAEWPESGSSKLYLSVPKSPVQKHKGYLFVTIGDGFEVEPMVMLLLAETDRALAGVKPVA